MSKKKEKQIKQELDSHLKQTVKLIKDNDGWSKIDIPSLSMKELTDVAEKSGLSEDEQTRAFCKFISIGTNFASMDFASRFQTIPDLVASICDLVEKMENEIKEFAEYLKFFSILYSITYCVQMLKIFERIAQYFSNLIKSFIKTVMSTKHNMKMALPHLEESTVHLKIMSEALLPESEQDLKENDLKDIEIALSSMSTGRIF